MNMDYRKNVKKRYIILNIFIIILFLSLSLRLYYLQIYSYEDLYAKAINQRGKEISLDSKRGIIFDRNKLPLTDNEIIPMALIEKSHLEKDDILFDELKNNTTLSMEKLYKLIDSEENLLQIPLKDKNLLKYQSNKLFIVNKINRYSKNNLLSHVLGYTSKSDNIGQTGIEKIYDEYLNKNDKNAFIIEYDKNRSLILDGGYYVNQDIDLYEPSGVKLTIDYKIQNIIENIIDRKKLNGAIIVNEAKSGEILGMVSRPNFDQEKIDEYLLSKDSFLFNKATQIGYPPGSIFKIIVLLTALEENPDILNMNYFCQGFEEINGKSISCSDEHGWISIEEGFAKSCNSLFIQMAEKLGGKNIINMAEKLGLGDKVNIVLEEIKGTLPNKDTLQGIALANTAIGQGNLETTPLQISNLLTIVANDGIQKPISLVQGITNKDGYMIKDLILEKESRVISEESAQYTKKLLGDVVTKGTAKSINIQDIGGAGGKTGSAQGSLDGRRVVHGWFSGFFPFDNPEYIISILIEDTNLGSRTAVPIFEEIVKSIDSLKKQN